MKVLFYDIETVSWHETLEDMKNDNPILYDEWMKKKDSKKDEWVTSNTHYTTSSWLDSAFCRICCISVGVEWNGEFIIKSFYGRDEWKIISDFFEFLENRSSDILCWYNNKFFDNPTVIQRNIKYGNHLPRPLNIYEVDGYGLPSVKKPREIKTIDLMELVRAGKQALSLNALCGHLNVATPKDAVIWSDIYPLYYKKKNLEWVKEYCEKDVKALYECYMKFLQVVDGKKRQILETRFLETEPTILNVKKETNEQIWETGTHAKVKSQKEKKTKSTKES